MHTKSLHDSSRTSRKLRLSAFTLIELLVVLTVLASVAAITVPRLGGLRRRMARETAVSQLVQLDQRARHLARMNHGSVTLCIDVDSSRLWCELEGEQWGPRTTLPIAADLTSFLSMREKRTSGKATVRFNPSAAESYAIKLTATEGGRAWILFAGISGQVSEFESSRDLQDIFERLSQ